ncbi:cytochrome [Echria macrotheca]|uniref:Cytochrome n=1 Tax=Echria macrotheca TaxID=438768 RepID=A0AAJ0B792_9PEZI|nr:cytochrome [Echria macrotheca]
MTSPWQHEAVSAFRTNHPWLFYAAASATTSLVLLVSLFLFLVEYFKPVGKRRGINGKPPILPPGPKGIPLLGNMLDMKEAVVDPYGKLFHDLKAHGEMATLHLGSKTWILLNSSRVCAELIAKRGSATNDRAPSPVISGILSHGDRRSLLMSADKWAEPRRVYHSLLSGTALRTYGAFQELESVQLLAEYLINPEKWHRHHLRYANGVIVRIALGERIRKSSRELRDLQLVVGRFITSVGMSIVDWFPDLARLPRFLQLGRGHWEGMDAWNYEVYSAWWAPARDKVLRGVAPPSFVRDTLLNRETGYTGDDDDALYVAMQLIEAGSDTTREALNVMVMAAITSPEPFARARREIDAVCGSDGDARLPVMEDMERLRYVCALAKEVLRWRPLFLLTPDHTATKDIEFEGYMFPAGVSFVINEVAVATECEEPDKFEPERWMDGHEMDILHGSWAFGGGRRVCVGYRLAQRSLFITISRLVQCFDFEANGPYDSRVLNPHTTEEPFPVKVTVRNQAYARLVGKEAVKAGVWEDAHGEEGSDETVDS